MTCPRPHSGNASLKVQLFLASRPQQNQTWSISVVLSPSYKKLPASFDNYIKTLSITYNVSILNHFCDNKFLEHPHYFKDIDHLNNEGAKVFSNIVAREVGSILRHKDDFNNK